MVDSWDKIAGVNKTDQARNRQDNLTNYWHRELPPIDFKGYEFRSWLIRRELRGKARIAQLDPLLTSFSWRDQALMTANMTFQNPSRDTPLPIKEGYEVKVSWAVIGAKHFRPLFRLRVRNLSRTASSGEVSAELVDELIWFAQSKDDFSFKQAKKNQPALGKRKKGWYAHQIAREVCRRYGISVGVLVKGKHLIKNLSEKDTSPLKIIAKAYKLDRDETGRSFVLGMKGGKLTVTLLKRSKDLLLVSENLLEATINEAIKDTFATVLQVTGTVKKGKRKRHKLDIEVKSGPAVMKRFGIVKDVWHPEDPVGSVANARIRAKRRLAHFQEPKKEISVELPGMPTVGRGDSLMINLKAEEYRKLVYVQDVEHNVGANGEYTMQVTCTVQEFFEDKEAEKIRKEQCQAARKKKRKPPGFCSAEDEPGFDPFNPYHPFNPNHKDRPPSSAAQTVPKGKGKYHQPGRK